MPIAPSNKVDEKYEGLGPKALRPLANPDIELTSVKLTPVEGFVLSRVDGLTSYREICMVTGLVANETVAILRRLKDAGLIFNPGETVPTIAPDLAAPILLGAGAQRSVGGPAPSAAATTSTHAASTFPADGAAAPAGAGDSGARARSPSPADGPSLLERLDDKSRIDPADLLGAPDLTDEFKTRLVRLHRRMGRLTAHQLLGVGSDAGPAVIKKAYFGASKELHPDRYYGRDIGRFRDVLEQVFRRCAEAFNELNEPFRKRKPSVVQDPRKP